MAKQPLYPHVPSKLPPTVTGPASLKRYASKQQISNQLANYIDKQVIANTVLEALEDEGISKPTFAQCKRVYLDFLEHEISDAMKRSVEYIPSL